jgi:hypothetical protein
MITPYLKKVATFTKKEWNHPDWWPGKGRDWTAGDYPTIEGTKTHCGTCELSQIHNKKGTESMIAKLVCFQVVRNQEGCVLYYAPHDPKFKKAVRTLQKFGFTKLHTGIHLGFLDREPDKGVFDLWYNQFTPEEVEEIKKWQPKKAPAQRARRRTPTSRSKTGRRSALAAAIVPDQSVQ